MSVSKRPASALSNNADATPSKKSKTADTARADFTDPFEVEIKIPSAFKAARNDYRPPSSARLKMRSIFKGGSASPLTEEEKQEIFGDLRGDLAEQSGQAAAPQTGHVEESRRRSVDNGEPSNQQSDKTVNAMMYISNDEDDSDNIDDDELREEIWDEDEYATDSNFDEYEDFDWFEAINGNIHLKQANYVAKQDPMGFCGSALIRRNMIRGAFYHEIEGPTEESSAMGFGLFDRYGRLKPAFKKHAFKSGSGIWGDELDIGDIHLIDQVRIDESHRHKGLGKMLLETILERGIAKSNPRRYVAIARDAVLFSVIEHQCEGKTEEEKRAIYDRQQHISQLFLRSLGFRRIGSTEWFARAGDKQHRCHCLPADQDFDPPPTSPSVPNSVMDTLFRDLKTLEADEARLDATQEALEGCMPNDSA